MSLVSVYQVVWHRSGTHNNANTQQNSSLVSAAQGAKSDVIASAIQTQNGDGKTVIVDHSWVLHDTVIS